MGIEEKYKIGDLSLYRIRNRNELRVIKYMREILVEYPEFEPDILDIQDIYALALNKLPSRYVQECSIVLQQDIDDIQIRDAIRIAIEKVKSSPNY